MIDIIDWNGLEKISNYIMMILSSRHLIVNHITTVFIEIPTENISTIPSIVTVSIRVLFEKTTSPSLEKTSSQSALATGEKITSKNFETSSSFFLPSMPV